MNISTVYDEVIATEIQSIQDLMHFDDNQEENDEKPTDNGPIPITAVAGLKSVKNFLNTH